MPVAFEVGFGMQALKWPKKLIDVGHVEARAVVANKTAHSSIFGLCAEVDEGGLRFSRELAGVIQQIGRTRRA